MEGISWVIVESSIALLDSPIHIFLICFCYTILNNSATPFPLTSLYPKLSLKVFRCYSQVRDWATSSSPQSVITFSIRCSSTYYKLGLALNIDLNLRAAFEPIRLTPHLKVSDLSFLSAEMPSTIWKYPLYPKFLVPTPISRQSNQPRLVMALPSSCPPSFSIQLKSKLRVSILSPAILLTNKLIGLTAFFFRLLKYASNLNTVSWLKFLSALAMKRVPFYSILLLRTNSYTDLSLYGLSLEVKILKFWKASGPSLLAVKSIDNSCSSSLSGCMNNQLTPSSPIFSIMSPNLSDLRSQCAIYWPSSLPADSLVVAELRLRWRCRTDCALICWNRCVSCQMVSLQLSRLMQRISTEMGWLKKLSMMNCGSTQYANDRVKLLISLFSRTDRNWGTYCSNYCVFCTQSPMSTALLPSTWKLAVWPIATTIKHTSRTMIFAIYYLRLLLQLQYLQSRRYYSNMDLITDHIAELKNMVSLRYVDPNLRDKAITTLRSHHQQETTTIPGMQICLAYIFKVEEVHDNMMQQVSQFLQQLTPFINECQHTIESSQQQLAQNAKMRSRELSQQQDMEYDMKRTMEMMGRQLNLRDQQTKELLLRIEEKDSIIYNLERQQSDYFKKMETDFEKQHKALQQSFSIITRLEEQNKALKKENMRLVELQLNRTLSVHAINQSPQIHIQDSNQQVNCSIQRSPHQEQNELHQCSLISSRSEGLSQFEGVHADENEIEQKQEFVLGQRQGSPALAKVETLKELLNVSVQKEYKLQYNNYESMQQRDQKQNYRANWLRGSKSNSKQKCEQWAVTNSIQLIENYQMSKKCVQEFKLALHGNSTQLFKKSVNPYHIYFLIASQNVKIRSEHFEAMCSIEAGPCWQVLMQKAVPLHEWQGEIEKYLVERCGH